MFTSEGVCSHIYKLIKLPRFSNKGLVRDDSALQAVSINNIYTSEETERLSHSLQNIGVESLLSVRVLLVKYLTGGFCL